MAVYQSGSRGEEVVRIQTKLRSLGHYKGPLDGEFGGGTEAAVKAFQKAHKLEVDGKVGPITWDALFSEAIPTPAIRDKPLNHRCLALTGAFETGAGVPDCFAGLSGDFDGQGISFGVLQWNFGQGSLQPLLKDMVKKHGKAVKSIFQEHYDVLLAALNSDQDEQMDFARSIQHPLKHFLYEPWRGMLKSLGRTEEFQGIQLEYAAGLFRSALDLCSTFDLRSARAAALMFDIKVQNGSISDLVRAQILRDFGGLPPGMPKEDLEVRRMVIVANRRAEAANPRWVEDVRARKLCIATGEGVVHGIPYHIEEQFGISLGPIS